MQKESAHIENFQNNLPKDLLTLQHLHEWYCITIQQVHYLLCNDAAVYTMSFSNELGRVSRLFLSAVTTGLMQAFLHEYYCRLCGEKLVLETRIDELQLLEKQQRYN